MSGSRPASGASRGEDPEVVTGYICPACQGEAYLCAHRHHGQSTWAIHCRSKIHHNQFGAPGSEPPALMTFEGMAAR